LRGEHLSLTSCDVSVREGIGLVAIGDQTGNRRDVLAFLDLDQYRMPAADIVERIPDRWRFGRAHGIARRLDDADRHPPAVREIERARHHCVGIIVATLAKFVSRDPLVDENQDCRPGVRTHLGILEGAPTLGLYDRRNTWPAILAADAIIADSCRNDIRMTHEMNVVLVARVEQIVERQRGIKISWSLRT